MTKIIAKEQFRIIGVRPLTKCAPHILKVLQPNTTYFLYNDYEENENGNFVRPKEGANCLDINFFSLDILNKKTPHISISAIVGKNGDGKSSIVELIIRIMNNFAVAVGFKEKQNDLEPVEGLHAMLFYSIGSKIFKITIEKNIVKFYDSIKKKYTWDTTSPLKDYTVLKEKSIEPLLFYTQVSNYSLYAFNSREFAKESSPNCWLDGVFHKNDGYQTPVVLNPWRWEGNIDINKENYLVKQRLLTLFTTKDNSNNSFRWINHKRFAKNIKLTLAENKLSKKTFSDFFYENRYTDYLHNETSFMQELFSSKMTSLSTKENQKMFLHKLITLNNFLSNVEKLMISNALIFNNTKIIHLQMINDLSTKEQVLLEHKSDLFKYIDIILALGKEYNNRARAKFEADYNKQFYKDIGKEVSKLEVFKHNTELSLFNIAQLYRIVQAIFFRERWVVLLDQFKQDEHVKDLAQRELILDYLTYKSMSIIEKYPIIKKNWYIDSYSTFLEYGDLSQQAKQAYLRGLDELLDDVVNKKTHISLKIRQTLSFLFIGTYFDQMRFNGNKKTYTLDFTSYYNEIEKIKKRGITKGSNRIMLNSLLSLPIEQLELLPPPIFETEIEVEQVENGEITSLSALSSGERQYLNTISTVIYHLQNLSSVEKENPSIIKYKHICLLMEEIELYFHPEMQKAFIKQVIQNIQKANLDEIDSINICFVTHSPYILSDIPKNNVLFMKEGKPSREMQENTFGANIHTLLQNAFFMSSIPIGDFARVKINNLFRLLHNKDFAANLLCQIELVSEPVLRAQLLRLYYEKYPKDSNLKNEIFYLRDEVEKLKRLLNDKN